MAKATAGGQRLYALNEAAERLSLTRGQLLADARAMVPDLQVRDADPKADAGALRQLASWCERFAPFVTPWEGENGNDGLFLDITGCERLFSGEAAHLESLTSRLAALGFTVRAAIADTPGTAWVMSHFGSKSISIVPPGEQAEHLRSLPVAALRLPGETVGNLARVGLKRIGDLVGRPRAPLAARFGARLLEQLDRALDREKESLSPFAPPVSYAVRRVFADPIVIQDQIMQVAALLADELMTLLERDGNGVREAELSLIRVDGEVRNLRIGTAAPNCDPKHIQRLVSLRLDALADGLDEGFGFECMILKALQVEPLDFTQHALDGAAANGFSEVGPLMDRLGNRLGLERVCFLHPVDTHIPERAVILRPARDGVPQQWPDDTLEPERPLLMLECAEPADVIAEVPEGPPRQFSWRKILYQVARAEGPERIDPEWWRPDERRHVRDYYRIEDQGGRRFWLYREGLYGREAEAPRWFVHGIFA